MKGQVLYGDYWYHLQEAWDRRQHPNLKFLWYEEMKKDLIGVIRDMSQFLNYHLTELQIMQINDFLDIDRFLGQ